MAKLYVGTADGMKQVSIASEEDVSKNKSNISSLQSSVSSINSQISSINSKISALQSSSGGFNSVEVSFSSNVTQTVSSIKGKQYIIVQVGNYVGIVFGNSVQTYIHNSRTVTNDSEYVYIIFNKTNGLITLGSSSGHNSATVYYK